MDNKKLAKTIQKLIQVEVTRQVKQLKREIITELSQKPRQLPRESIVEDSEFDRVLENISTIPHLKKNVVDKVQRPVKQRQYTSNPGLNAILNETAGFSGEELDDSSMSILDMMEPSTFDADTSPVFDIQQTPGMITRSPSPTPIIDKSTDTMIGTDNKPVNLNDPTVQTVMSILENTNFKEKYDRIKEAGDKVRESLVGHMRN